MTENGSGSIGLLTYFDQIYCINLERRSDKLSEFSRWADKLFKWKRINAVDGTTLVGHARVSQKLSSFELGCILSHRLVLNDALNAGHERILILEDDVIPATLLAKFDRSFESLGDWAMIYLGANQHPQTRASLKPLSNGANVHSNSHPSLAGYHASNTRGTFAYAVRKPYLLELIGLLDRCSTPADNAYHEFQQKNYGLCPVIQPNLFIADVTSSDIRASRNQQAFAVKMQWDLRLYRKQPIVKVLPSSMITPDELLMFRRALACEGFLSCVIEETPQRGAYINLIPSPRMIARSRGLDISPELLPHEITAIRGIVKSTIN